MKGFENEAELLEHYQSYASNSNIFALVFHNHNTASKELDYDIRIYVENLSWETNKLYHKLQYITGQGKVFILF